MNWQHLQTFVWLRWRLMANQWSRAGALNTALSTIIAVGAVVLAIPSFLISLGIGIYAFPEASPTHLLYVWNGLIVGFVLCWGVGLLTDLQRTDSLALSKFLHLPVSVNGAFLINYLSSLVRLTLVIFVPVLFGLGLALVIARGIGLLSVLPLTAAFLLMVTALTYQFQGWLASLMSNPRRRRTVVFAATALFMLIVQLPNLVNMYRPWRGHERNRNRARAAQMEQLNRDLRAQKIDSQEYVRRQQEIMLKHGMEEGREAGATLRRWERGTRLANLVLPIGWLPLGVTAAAEGRAGLVVLSFSGMTLIGAASLWRAYRTTIALYQGRFTARRPRHAAAATNGASASPSRTGALFLEARLPGVSESASAVALAGLRSLIRSPEAKMMLLMPVVFSIVFGPMLLRVPPTIPELVRPLIGIGTISLVLFCLLQLMCNQFGLDRDGFRVFVLSAAPRRDILLGKNLAFIPFGILFAGIALTLLQVVQPMRWDHLLAMPIQFVSMFFLFCILTNQTSIYAPMQIAQGSLKPANVKVFPILLQMAMVMFIFPLTQLPTLVPLGIEAVLQWSGMTMGIPVFLMLSLAQCAIVVAIYRYALEWQGRQLEAREQRILECITGRAA